MSRVIYANTLSTDEQDRVRATHQVRLVTAAEEGMGVNALPTGVYGFTYSPALPSAPLFADRRFRSYETHKRHDGAVVLIGFISAEHAIALSSATAEVEITLQPEPEEGADTLAIIPYALVSHHRQYAVRTEHGITLRLSPMP